MRGGASLSLWAHFQPANPSSAQGADGIKQHHKFLIPKGEIEMLFHVIQINSNISTAIRTVSGFYSLLIVEKLTMKNNKKKSEHLSWVLLHYLQISILFCTVTVKHIAFHLY